MQLREIDPFVRQAIIGTLSAKTKRDVFFELQAPDTRLFYICGGEGDMIIEGARYPMSRGCVILLKAGTKYTWCPARNSALEYIAINFDYTSKNSDISAPFHPAHSDVFRDEDIVEVVQFDDVELLNEPVIIPDSSLHESHLRQIVTEHSLGAPHAQALTSSMLKIIIINVVRELQTSESHLSEGGIQLTQDIIKYIQRNYRDTITYDTLGDLFHLNPIYINRVFKRNTGVPLHAFILNYRINMAMELLRSSNIPVKDIATMVGFTDFPHFQKTFKRLTKNTPTEYRISRDPR